MKLVDIHCHLQAEVFKKTLPTIVKNAKSSGIEYMINNATCPDDWDQCLNLSENYSSIKTALGIHPWYIPPYWKEHLTENNFHKWKNAVAVGEIGIDRRFSGTDLSTQIEVFEKQLILAKETRLPAIVHCINAYAEVINSIKKIGLSKKGMILHAFNGNRETAEMFKKYNVFFSIGGTITYRDSRKREEMLKYIYPDRILLETDSPDIPPAEKKHTTNYPENIIYILNACSEILGIDIEIVSDKTFKNSLMIFNL